MPLAWLIRLFRRPAQEAPEIRAARALIAAIDRGGIPLNPARVNAIARDLGLDVSRTATMPDTVLRIRAALARSCATPARAPGDRAWP